MTAQTATASTVHHPFGSPSGPGLFRVKGLQLPAYIQNVAHALMRKGSLDESRAIGMAVGIVRNWSAGHDGHGHKVSADVQAAAAKAIAEWEADKARAHAHTSEHTAVDLAAAWKTELRGSGGQWITVGGKPARVTKLRYRGGAGGFGHLKAIEAIGNKYQPSGELATSPPMSAASTVYRTSMRSAARFTAMRKMDEANRALDVADWAGRNIGPGAQIDARRVRASLAAVGPKVSYRTDPRPGAQKMRGQHPGVYRDPLDASNQDPQREAIILAQVATAAQVNIATGATGPRSKPPSSGKAQPQGGGGSGFDAKHPRVGAGNTGGGRFAKKGSGTTSAAGPPPASGKKKPAAKKAAAGKPPVSAGKPAAAAKTPAAKAPAKKAAAGKAAPPKMTGAPKAAPKPKAKPKPKPDLKTRAGRLQAKTQLHAQAANDRAKARAIFKQITQLTAAIHAQVKASAASKASTTATKTAATAAKTAAATTAAAAKTAATAATSTAKTTASTTAAKTTSSVPAMRAKRATLRVQAHTLVTRANSLDKQAAAIHLTNAGPAAALEMAGTPFREELARRVPAGKPGGGQFVQPADQLTRHATPDQTAVAVNRLASDQRAVCRATVMPPPGYEWGTADRLIVAGGAELAAPAGDAIELGVGAWLTELRDRHGKWSKNRSVGAGMIKPVRPAKARAARKPGRLSALDKRIHSRDEQAAPIEAMEGVLPSLAKARTQGPAVRNAAASLSGRPSDQPITAADLQAAVSKAVADLHDSEAKITAEEDKRRRTKLAVHAGAIVAGTIAAYVESRTPGVPSALAEATAPGLLVAQELVDWARRL